MATKLDRTMTSLDGLLPMMSHEPLITWPCKIQGSITRGGSAIIREVVTEFLCKNCMDKFHNNIK